MQKISEKFKKNGYDFRLIKRKYQVTIYEQSSDGVVYAYDVHKIRLKSSGIAKYRNSDGSYRVVEYPEREVLASDEDFGTYGWNYQTYNLAIEKFEELLNKEEKKNEKKQ